MNAIERHGDHRRHGRHLARRRRPGTARASSACSTGASARGRCRSWARPNGTSRSTSPRCTPAARSPSRKCSARAEVAVIGYGPYEALFEKRGIDPIGKQVRIGSVEYTVIGVVGKRPSPGGFALGAGRLRDHSVHRVPQAVRQREACSAARCGIPVDGRGAAEGRRDARRGDARGRDDHAHSPRPDARQAERLRPGHLGRDPRGLGSDLRRRSCCRWS